MRQRKLIFGLLLALAAALLVAGCGAKNQNGTAKNEQADSAQTEQTDTASAEEPDTKVIVRDVDPEPAPQPETTCMNCGTVVAIEEHDTIRGKTSKEAIAGAVIGAVAGVMLGSSQFSGDEETAAEIAGGVAGAVAGYTAGRRAYTDAYYIVRVDMNSGGTKVIRVPEVGSLYVGQAVRVDSGTIRPR